MGTLLGNRNIRATFRQCLWAHNYDRNPRIQGSVDALLINCHMHNAKKGLTLVKTLDGSPKVTLNSVTQSKSPRLFLTKIGGLIPFIQEEDTAGGFDIGMCGPHIEHRIIARIKKEVAEGTGVFGPGKSGAVRGDVARVFDEEPTPAPAIGPGVWAWKNSGGIIYAVGHGYTVTDAVESAVLTAAGTKLFLNPGDAAELS